MLCQGPQCCRWTDYISHNARGVNGEELSGADVCDSYSKMGHWGPSEWPLLTGNHLRHAHDVTYFNVIFKYVQKFTWKHEDVSTWGRNRAVSRARGAWRPCHRRAGKGKEGSLRLRFCIPLRHQEAPWITGRFLEIETLNKQKQNVKSLHRQFSYFKIFIQSWYIRALFLTNIYTQVYFDQEHKVILENSVNIL